MRTMCGKGFRDHGARPMGENLRSKKSGQLRRIQTARSRIGKGARIHRCVDALTARPSLRSELWTHLRTCSLRTDRCTSVPMKRRELERRLRSLGWRFVRHGGKHDVWSDGEREETVPRHTEINEKLATVILVRAKKV